ncbi:MAG: intermembrane transport protein PqiB [Stellaceae bacterium]
MKQTATGHGEAVAEPEIRRSRFSVIWILPIVALLVAAWLGYTTLAEKGPTITITFNTAAGLEAGKTRIKHHDVDLGVVKRIDPTPDLSQVVVSAQMNKLAAPHLNDGTNFWVVRPRLSLTSLSGLETLVSGSFIEMDPGAGADQRTFKGLEQPPVVRSDVSGTTYILTTNKIGSIGSGSPMFFRGIEVGEVIGYTFGGIDKPMTIRVFVQKPYDAFIHEGTRFWNASGISLTTGAGGFKVEVESLQAVLSGGIAFEAVKAAPQAKADTIFALYDDRGAAEEAGFTKRARMLVEFEGTVRGLAIGAPVEAQGITIGRVVDFHLVVDAAKKTVRVPVVCEIELDRVGVTNLPPEQLGKGKLMAGLVALGLRAQLRTSSLLTGELFVALDFFPDAPPAEIIETDTYPQVPTVPTQLESLTRSVSQTLDKLAALPLDDIVKDARKTLDAAQRLMVDANSGATPLLTSLRQTSDAADSVLKSMGSAYGRDSQVRGELSDLLRQLQETLKSVKTLASYLEQHPESLVRGKGASQ